MNTWILEGFVLYNAKVEGYVIMQNGVPYITHNLLDAHLFLSEEDAKKQIKYIGHVRAERAEEDRICNKYINPDNWEVRVASLTAIHS